MATIQAHPLPDVETLESQADVGELAGVVAHEMTNFLNLCLLQVKILEAQHAGRTQEDLAILRRLGDQATAVITRFQEYRRHPTAPTAVDLGAVVEDVAHRLAAASDEYLTVRLGEPADHPDAVFLSHECGVSPARIQGRTADVTRLVRFLLSNAARVAAQAARHVHVAVEPAGDGVRLRVTAAVPAAWPADVSGLFEWGFPASEGVESLELMACASLVRRLRGSLRAERHGAEVSVVVEFPPVPRR